MGRNTRSWVLTLLLGLIPLATRAQDQAERRSIDIRLTVPKTDAFNRAMEAFVREGLVVGQADLAAGVIVSVPKVSGGMLKVASIYRANILAVGDTASTVILSGGYTSKDVDQLAGQIAGTRHPVLSDEQPLTSKMRRTLGQAWQVLERVASALQGPP